MRLTHLAATLLLATMLGCSANATVTAGTPEASASPSPTATATASPSASPSPVASQAPASACLAAFDAYNTDKDTFVSLDEYVAGRWSDLRFIKAPTAEEETTTKNGFREEARQADKNNDGRLSREEYAATCT